MVARISWIPAGSSPFVGSSKQLGVLEQGTGDRQALLHAQRVAAEPVLAAVAEADLVQHHRDPLDGGADALREQGQVLPARERGEEAGLLHDGPDPADHPRERSRHDLVEQPHLAGVGPDQPEQHPDGGRLAGAVGSQEAVHAAAGHPQVELGHSHLPSPAGTVGLAESVGLDSELGGRGRRSLRNGGLRHLVPSTARAGEGRDRLTLASTGARTAQPTVRRVAGNGPAAG
jgi:hypothetical protein